MDWEDEVDENIKRLFANSKRHVEAIDNIWKYIKEDIVPAHNGNVEKLKENLQSIEERIKKIEDNSNFEYWNLL